MFINTISESKSKTFNQCNLKYKYKYINRFQEERTKTDALHFGSYIHKIFEDGVEAKDMKSLLTIAESIKKDYKFSKSYDPKVEPCLKNFLRFGATIEGTIATELVYETTVDEEHQISLNGVIDRVVKGKDGGYLVIDYKTSKRELSEFDLYQDRQMQGYAYAVHKMFKVPLKSITVAHYYPITNNFVHVKYSNAQIRKYLKDKIEEVWRIRKMKTTEFCASRNMYCNWCGYQDICPLFSSTTLIEQRISGWKRQKKRKR